MAEELKEGVWELELDNEDDRNSGKIEIPTADRKRTLWLRPVAKGQALPSPGLYRQLAKFRIRPLTRVLKIEEANRSDEMRWIAEWIEESKNRDYEGPDPTDDAFWVEETRELVEHLAIIGLYRTVELMTKQSDYSGSGFKVQRFKVQGIHEDWQQSSRHPPARTIGASGDQALATASPVQAADHVHSLFP